ncbi:SETMR methyltransferase, partial [Pseudoatta argentina]
MLVEVYGNTAPTDKLCREWFRRFKDGDFRIGSNSTIHFCTIESHGNNSKTRKRSVSADELIRLSRAPEYEQRHDKVIFLHDNARPHVTKVVNKYLETLKWDVRYCETLKKLRRAIQNKRRGMLTAGVSLLHNARPHVTASTTALLNQFSWDVLTHPPYSPNLAPSDYHLFTKLKESLAGKRFQSDEKKNEHIQLGSECQEYLNELMMQGHENVKEYRYPKNIDKYPNLTKLLNAVQSLPNSNADAERMFSFLTDLKRDHVRVQGYEHIPIGKTVSDFRGSEGEEEEEEEEEGEGEEEDESDTHEEEEEELDEIDMEVSYSHHPQRSSPTDTVTAPVSIRMVNASNLTRYS